MIYWSIMTKCKNIRKPDAQIYNLLGLKTKSFLEIEDRSQIIDWLEDSKKLLDLFMKGNNGWFDDYTFIVTPAFKALERWIFIIAPYIGIPEERVNKIRSEERSVGGLLRNEEELLVFLEEVLNKIDSIQGVRDNLTTEIIGLKSLLKSYRHKIAHCWKTLDLPDDAELYINQIIANIRRVTEELANSGIIKA